MRRTSEKEIEAILALNAAARFLHFIKRVVDAEMAWGLWKEGWALMADDSGNAVFPLWPAREYAELHRTGDWASYEVTEISLPRLLDELLPKLSKRTTLAGVFPTPSGKGLTLRPEEVAASLREELTSYE